MPAIGENMSEKSIRLPVEPQSNAARLRIASIAHLRRWTSPKFVKSLAPPPVCTTFLTLRKKLELKDRAFIELFLGRKISKLQHRSQRAGCDGFSIASQGAPGRTRKRARLVHFRVVGNLTSDLETKITFEDID
jgi:hypothetical protein